MSLDHITHLSCVLCDKRLDRAALGTCPECGPAGTLEVRYDIEAAKTRMNRASLAADPDPSVARYRAILPIPLDAPLPPLPVWRTPLIKAGRFPWKGGELWIKDDSRLPSSSFKDRATVVAVTRALSERASGIICASTGNAASSLAAFSAAAGLPAVILVPKSAPKPKLAQVLISGARVLPVDGNYDAAFDLSMELAPKLGYFLRSTGVNPVLAEGKKTCALEIAEQFDWQPPEVVAVSVGDGCIISGLAKGFSDLVELGLIERAPRLLGVQAEGSAALARAFERGLDRPEPISATTIADSISVDLPRDGARALRGVRACGGRFITVSDDEILAAMKALASSAGVFAEPAGATAAAGLTRLAEEGGLAPGERACAVVTGSMLKDTKSALRAIGGLPEPVAPTVEAAMAALNG